MLAAGVGAISGRASYLADSRLADVVCAAVPAGPLLVAALWAILLPCLLRAVLSLPALRRGAAMKALIVGGSGGIGSALARRLHERDGENAVTATWYRQPPSWQHDRLTWVWRLCVLVKHLLPSRRCDQKAVRHRHRLVFSIEPSNTLISVAAHFEAWRAFYWLEAGIWAESDEKPGRRGLIGG